MASTMPRSAASQRPSIPCSAAARVVAGAEMAGDGAGGRVGEEVEDAEGGGEHDGGDRHTAELLGAQVTDNGGVGEEVEGFGDQRPEGRDGEAADLPVVGTAPPPTRRRHLPTLPGPPPPLPSSPASRVSVACQSAGDQYAPNRSRREDGHTIVGPCRGGEGACDRVCDDGSSARGRVPRARPGGPGVQEPTSGREPIAEHPPGGGGRRRRGPTPRPLARGGGPGHGRGDRRRESAARGSRDRVSGVGSESWWLRWTWTSHTWRQRKAVTSPLRPGWRNGRRRRLKPAGSVRERESSNLSPGTAL